MRGQSESERNARGTRGTIPLVIPRETSGIREESERNEMHDSSPIPEVSRGISGYNKSDKFDVDAMTIPVSEFYRFHPYQSKKGVW